MNAITVKIRKLHPDATPPTYATALAAGFDLVAVEDVIIAPGETALVPTGLAFEIPPGYEMSVRPRSGITKNTKLRVGNSPGTVDADFRGEVKVIVDNTTLPEYGLDLHEGRTVRAHCGQAYTLSGECVPINGNDHVAFPYFIRKGDRIAQAVITPIMRATFEVTDVLTETERGDGGFGHSGVTAQEAADNIRENMRQAYDTLPSVSDKPRYYYSTYREEWTEVGK